jgi:hypothetical protein
VYCGALEIGTAYGIEGAYFQNLQSLAGPSEISQNAKGVHRRDRSWRLKNMLTIGGLLAPLGGE